MQGNGANSHDGASAATFVTVLLTALVASAIVTTVALVVADRIDRPDLVVAVAPAPTIAAQIEGAVATPGVYPLPTGARLDDLVRAAGGLSRDANVADLNLAARVGDGERVLITRIDRATPVPVAPGGGSTAAPLLIDINTAGVDELDQLPGIGPVIGERIVAYRDQNGPFTSLDDLANVEGISTRLLERLRPYITLGG